MSKTKKNKLSPGWLVLVLFLGAVDLGLLLARLMRGHNIALFNPRGLIAKEEHHLMLYTAGIMMKLMTKATKMLIVATMPN